MRYLGIFTLSAAILLLELSLTRIYSVSQGYHFAFLAVSLGLLGFGASGTALAVIPGLLRVGPRLFLGTSALLFTLATLGSYAAINHIPFDAYQIVWQPGMLLYLVLYYLAPTVPFFFGGMALGGALTLQPERAGALYGASLAGSGVGSLLALGGPVSSGPASAVALVALLGALSLAAFWKPRGGRALSLALAVLAGVVLAAIFIPHQVNLFLSPYKALSQVLRQQGARHLETRWNAFSRVDVVEAPALHAAPGLSLAYNRVLPPQRGLTIDGDNLTPITPVASEEGEFTRFLPSALPYRLLSAPRVLVVEPQGGLDVLTALHHGAMSVTALVGNPLVARAANPIDDGRVRTAIGNPRSYLKGSRERFDLVVVSMADAFRPVTPGAYGLSENYTYTVEAFQDYYRHLSPEGLLLVTRWLQVPPSEEVRAVATLVQAMESLGIQDPGERVVVLRSLQTLTVLARAGPFTDPELAQVRAFAQSLRLDLVYYPGITPGELNRYFVLPEEVYHRAISSILDPSQRSRFYRSYDYDVSPPGDDKPFFFHFFKWRQVSEVLARLGREWQPFGGMGFLVVAALLLVAIGASTLFILLPLLLRQAYRRVARGPLGRWRVLVYFSALGLAFLWVELPLMQRFILLLDQPIFSFGVVLFSLLLFSGLGSLASARIGRLTPVTLGLLILVTLAHAYGVRLLLPGVLGLALPLRMLLAVLLIAPLGFLMGLPFPAGIRVVDRHLPGFIPWAWGVNGCASVVASVLAVLIALAWGFSWVLTAAALCYLLALGVLYRWLREVPARRAQT